MKPSKQLIAIPYYMEKEDALVSLMTQKFNNDNMSDEMPKNMTDYRSAIVWLGRAFRNMGYGKVKLRGRYDNYGILVSHQEQFIDYENQHTKIIMEITSTGRSQKFNMVAIYSAIVDNYRSLQLKFTNLSCIKVCKIDWDINLKPIGPLQMVITVGHNYLIGKEVLDETRIIK